MQLQGALHQPVRPEVKARIDAVIDDLDTTIRDIRGAIFELRAPAAQELRGEIRALIEQARGALGFRPHLTVDGPIDTAVPDEVQPVVLAVLREALSNVARHARAGTVEVAVSVRDGWLHLLVADDGTGIGDAPRSGGLRNMRQRAEELGGEFTADNTEPHGARLSWRVPVG
jgi:signal transduction histidine kinase